MTTYHIGNRSDLYDAAGGSVAVVAAGTRSHVHGDRDAGWSVFRLSKSSVCCTKMPAAATADARGTLVFTSTVGCRIDAVTSS